MKKILDIMQEIDSISNDILANAEQDGFLEATYKCSDKMTNEIINIQTAAYKEESAARAAIIAKASDKVISANKETREALTKHIIAKSIREAKEIRLTCLQSILATEREMLKTQI